MRLLGAWVRVPMDRLVLPRAERDPPEGDAVELWVPRGDVRADDFAALAMDVDLERVVPSGALEIRSGSETLWSEPFRPRHGFTHVAVPPDVRARLPERGTVTWGWWPADGPPVIAAVRMVSAETVGKDLRALDARLDGAPEALARQVRAQWFLDRGLSTAAFREAWPLAEPEAAPSVGSETAADPAILGPNHEPAVAEPDLRALSVQHRALAALGLEESRRAAAIAAAIRSAPRERLARLFTLPESPGR
jgi:hypothetical protein